MIVEYIRYKIPVTCRDFATAKAFDHFSKPSSLISIVSKKCGTTSHPV
jgi:hypothetical protein